MEILKTLSYVGTMDVLFTICKGKTKFTDIMFETELNPGILNRLLKTLMSADILIKDRDGYHMSERGAKIVLYTLKILDTESEHKNEDYRNLIEVLSARIEGQKAGA
jgi:predicted transcriptional regulator